MTETANGTGLLGGLSRQSLLRKWRKNLAIRFGSLEDRFTQIYRGNWWLSDESVSGPGSTLETTEDIRAFLPSLLKQFSVRTFLDAPCGDFNWMKEIRADLDVDYIGVDIVKELVDHAQRRYGDERTRFAHLDITRDPLPTADLMMARDFFIHLSFADANRAIENFLRSGIEYLLTGTAPVGDMVVNNDMRTGKARRRCLYSPPFNFPTNVLAKFRDRVGSEMCLWSRQQIAETLSKAAHPKDSVTL
jgi:SAM-dependent methyltransferase